MNLSREKLLSEVVFKTSRSGGKGGQNVNKVSTKVELNLDIESSELFTEEEKIRLLNKLRNKIIAGHVLQIITEEERTQLGNKDRSIKKLMSLLEIGLKKDIPRKATKPKRSAIEKRLKSKQQQALKKINRRRGWQD